MTVKELSALYDIPVRRIRKAIKRGWLKASRKKKRAPWEVDEAEFQIAIRFRIDATRDDRNFLIREVKNFVIISRHEVKFSTTAAAERFEELYKNQP